MSFRGRLFIFFTIIVIVPMAAVGVVLFKVTSDSETGKSDSRIAQGLTTALAVYQADVDRAQSTLTQVARDPQMSRALARRKAGPLRARARVILKARPDIAAIVFYNRKGGRVAAAQRAPALAYATAAPTTAKGTRVGTLAVSRTTANDFVASVKRLTGLDAAVNGAGARLAATRSAGGRSRFQQVQSAPLPAVAVGVFDQLDRGAVASSRALIGAILAAFLLLALASSVLVVRALQGQIGDFLGAAQRLGKGDFSNPVPVHGKDEFADLGREFNKMSGELEAHIAEVERKRKELEEAIRRVGEAVGAGFDREGVVALVVRTAIEACGAEAGRALPIDARRMEYFEFGLDSESGSSLRAGLVAAEREAFQIDPEIGRELLAALEPSDGHPLPQRRPTTAQLELVHGMALPMRARISGGPDIDFVGVISIARRDREFSEEERDLFAYLAGQATLSIENVDLHETVQQQAVTDELTGLFNVRQFHSRLDGEIERAERFGTPLSLVMLDIDKFKSVNDTYGHQQGDRVLVEVARVLRRLSRDVDLPARYGGEEMAVVLPQTDLGGAELGAERMRAAIESMQIPRLDGGGLLPITASFGVAAFPSQATGKTALIAAADAALYRAKRGGRNRVERAEAAAAAR
ncbi:MAG TPA: diguanylate cyclase [Thermoleophilaceae bacterium]|nr:diguanylate cyclase [Thermoleophilaceae bacterium]